ncbi:DUF6179 domain-containing protein [Anaerosporobacter faecicola]|uniref:DUF6179 domain-containing protein n=1 Tax=Anaerosporobacter faecicola TaxID=2718714 RepID=UPI00143B9C7A|nr:DUF6179 domain-containing protein [Anaerosporobacter faecicola]
MKVEKKTNEWNAAEWKTGERKDHGMEDYAMEEFVPIVSKLVERYTSKESSSVSVAVARQLMEAVVYCIHYGLRKSSKYQLDSGEKIPAQTAYELGYQRIMERTKQLNDLYTSMLPTFSAYDNRAYIDTIMKGMPAFFLHYDVQFAPQDQILTLDYPILRPLGQEEGIEAIDRYLQATILEQTFLRVYPEEYVRAVLEQYHEDHKELLINISSIVLQNSLLSMWLRKPLLSREFSLKDCDWITDQVLMHSSVETEQILERLLQILIKRGYEDNQELYAYLSYEIHELTIRLRNAAEHENMALFLGCMRGS